MVPSLDIPKAMEKIKMVLGLSAIPKWPINPAVISKGMRLGNVDMITIFQLLNNKAIKTQIKKIAESVLSIKLTCKYSV
jgi:hypothetical protein